MEMLSLECSASPFLLEESSRLAPFLEPEAAAGAGFRRKCLVFNVHASDARLDGGTSRNGKNRTLRNWNGSERSKLSAFHTPILAPDVITREIDVFPAEG